MSGHTCACAVLFVLALTANADSWADTDGSTADLEVNLGTDADLVPEVQTVTSTSNDTMGGTFTLTYDGQTTGDIAAAATAAQVDTALEALTTIPVDGVTVVRGPAAGNGFPYTVTWTDVGPRVAITSDFTSLTGTSAAVAVVTTIEGIPDMFISKAPGPIDKQNKKHICVEKYFINGPESADAECSGNPTMRDTGFSPHHIYNNGVLDADTVDQGKYVDSEGHFIAGICKKGSAEIRAGEGLKPDDICGPVHVIDFEAGRMILEYKPDLIENEKPPCSGGMFLPFVPGEFMWGPEAHALIFFLMMGFSFLGIAIIADVFMAAIEVITSKTNKVTVVVDGVTKEKEVKVWNDTIANLTLMALGSSAPEILLSVLETIGMLNKPADPGGLGPGTIVGSAAFNLLVISAICVMAIDKDDKGNIDYRHIKEIGVFSTTAFYSIFAYVWLFICVKDNQILLWEAVVTFMLFPVLCIQCYAADKKWGPYGLKMCNSKITATDAAKDKGDLAAVAASTDAFKIATRINKADNLGAYGDGPSDLAREQALEDCATLALQQSGVVQSSTMKSKINARRGLTGGKRVMVAKGGEAHGNLDSLDKANVPAETKSEIVTSASGAKIGFSSPTYAAEEGKGKVTLTVTRTDDTSGTVHVNYATSDGTALSGEDFVFKRGVISFAPGDVSKNIEIALIDDTSFEPDENFYVQLSKAKGGKKGPGDSSEYEFIADFATVTILNDDKPGTFGFEADTMDVTEDSDYAELKVIRASGCDGEVVVSYKTIDGSATGGTDFESTSGNLVFTDGECEHTIKVKLIEDDQFEKNEKFSVELSMDLAKYNGALFSNQTVEVTILGDEEAEALAKQIAEIMQRKMDEMNKTIESGSYTDQFNEAMNICGEEGEEPGRMDYIMHFLTFGWKVIFATVPPTSWSGGWVTFFVALGYIGVLTAFVADIASIFGCLCSLPDAITAITFVALGTSLPDTFASKSAATSDETADNAVGNVTGSNSVNVFLGLGLPWLLATLANSDYTPPMVPGMEFIDGVENKVTIDGKDITFEKGSFPVLAGTMGSSVILFCICAAVCIFTLYVRRWMGLGELGGPAGPRKLTGAFFICLWMIYIVVSSLLEKKHIEPFI
jgi:solute carrier family 8 (sodium/calcium exchanger)